MSRGSIVDGAAVPDRAKRYDEQIDRPVQPCAHFPAHAIRSALTSDVRVCTITPPNQGTTETPACANQRASHSPARRLRKVAGHRDINVTALQCDQSHNTIQQQQPQSADETRHASPEAPDGHADGLENAARPKRWFMLRRKRRSTKPDDAKDKSNSSSPKSSAEYGIPAVKEQSPHAKKSRSNDRPRNKLRKLPPPTLFSQEMEKGTTKGIEYRHRGKGINLRFKKSKHSPKASASPSSSQYSNEGFLAMASGGGEVRGSLNEVVISDAVMFNLSAERDSRARDLARKWLEAGRSKPATCDEDSDVIEQGDSNTERRKVRAKGRDTESVQLEDEWPRTDRKAYPLSRFREHLRDSDSDEDDVDIDDCDLLNVPYTSNTTDQVSEFLGPASSREQLAVVNSDSLITEEARCMAQRQVRETDCHWRRRNYTVTEMRGQDVVYAKETPTLRISRARANRRQLTRIARFQQPRLMSPIPELPTPSPQPSTPEQGSPVPDQTSSISQKKPPSPVASDSASFNDYVSCRSTNSTSNTATERSTIVDETEIGIARSRSLTRVVEPELRSVSVPRPKGKERQDRVDTPLFGQNGLSTLPPLKDYTPWWEQTPCEPKVVPKFACGPRPSEAIASSSSRAKGEKRRAPTPEAGVLPQDMTAPSKPARPRADRDAKGKRPLSVGRPGIAADLEYKFKHEDEVEVESARSSKRSVSEQAVGMHLPVQEPVEIPREELERIFRGM